MADTLRYAQNVFKALAYAAEKHSTQRRKDSDASPYINHPIQVAEVLATAGRVDDLAILVAAILHDTVEDTEATTEELEDLFGSEVAGLVAEITDDKSLPKTERKRLQVEHAPHLSNKAKQIKIADKACNVREIGSRPPAHWDEHRRQKYFDWAATVVAGCRGVNRDLEEYFDACAATSARVLAQNSSA